MGGAFKHCASKSTWRVILQTSIPDIEFLNTFGTRTASYAPLAGRRVYRDKDIFEEQFVETSGCASILK